MAVERTSRTTCYYNMLDALKKYENDIEEIKVLDMYYKDKELIQYLWVSVRSILSSFKDRDDGTIKMRISPSRYLLDNAESKNITLNANEKEYLKTIIDKYPHRFFNKSSSEADKKLKNSTLATINYISRTYPLEKEILDNFTPLIKRMYKEAYYKIKKEGKDTGKHNAFFYPSVFMKTEEYKEAKEKEAQSLFQREERLKSILEKKEKARLNKIAREEAKAVERMNRSACRRPRYMEQDPHSKYRGLGKRLYDFNFFEKMKKFGVRTAETKIILDKFYFLMKSTFTAEDARDYLDVFDRHSIKSDNGAAYRRATTM